MIKVTDVAYARFRAPDLNTMETFLTDFGLEACLHAQKRRFICERVDPTTMFILRRWVDPAFIGMAFHAASEEDLRTLSQSPSASDVEGRDEPGGGKRVRLTDPNGFLVEAVHGIEQLPKFQPAMLTT